MPDDKSKIEELNEKLSSRTGYLPPSDNRSPVSNLPGEHKLVEEKWNAPELDEMLRYERRSPEKKSFTTRIFIFALVFFLCAAGAAGYIYLAGGNFISSKNVDISVNGPVTVSAGDVLNLGIVVTNKNNADLETAILAIRYPDGSRDALDSTKALSYQKTDLGVIKSGEEFSTSTAVVMYGQKGDTKAITITLEYSVKNSQAHFTKEKIYEVSLGTTPLSMTINEPDTVRSGDVFTTSVDIVSNSTEVLKNVVIKGEYPYGFAVTDTTPGTTNSGKNFWSLGDMAPGDKKTITLKGRLSGQDGEERTFRFSGGVAEGSTPDKFNILAMANDTIAINRPDVAVSLTLNGDPSDSYTAPAGGTIHGVVSFSNNLSENLRNAQVVVKFSGNSLDRFSVSPQNNGFYDSTNNQIVWSASTNPELAALAPGGNGTYTFQFASLSNLPANATKQEIDLTASVLGTPEGGTAISVADNKAVKIGSQVSLTALSLFSKGPFKNTGSIPPTAEKETTYTIALTLKDTQNDVVNPKITATLGSNVKWLTQVSPSTENLLYNDTTKSLTWTTDKLTSGTGFSAPAKVIYFQVALTPSLGQIGSVPILLSNIVFSGQDAFTGKNISLSLQPVTTRFDTDSRYVQGDETVVK